MIAFTSDLFGFVQIAPASGANPEWNEQFHFFVQGTEAARNLFQTCLNFMCFADEHETKRLEVMLENLYNILYTVIYCIMHILPKQFPFQHPI